MAYGAVPLDVREAAELDGASAIKVLWFIELPLMLPTLVIAVFIRFIDGFRVFDNVYASTGSGAGGSTTSLSIYIYQAFFKEGAIGKAVAASVLLFLASLAVLYALNWLAGRRRK
jgi:multiple sugar transport system permease protein